MFNLSLIIDNFNEWMWNFILFLINIKSLTYLLTLINEQHVKLDIYLIV